MTDTDRRTEPEPSPMPETETTPAPEPNVFDRLHRVGTLMYQAAEAAIAVEHTAPGAYRLSCDVRVDEQQRVTIANLALIET